MLKAVLARRRPLRPEPVYRMLMLLCRLVLPRPVGTSPGMLPLWWMLVSGPVLAARGAVIPGVSACGLPQRAVRRAGAALGQGSGDSRTPLARWGTRGRAAGRLGPQQHGG